MKKHSLETEFHSTSPLSRRDTKKVQFYMNLASDVFSDLLRSKIIPSHPAQRFEVSLLICGDKKIRKLNLEFRNKDKATDVLSFPSQENLRKNPLSEDTIFLGDLAISIPTARRQAKEFNISVWDEFIHLYFHGLFHLMGYDHDVSAAEEKLMQKWEDQALELLSAKKKGSRKAPL